MERPYRRCTGRTALLPLSIHSRTFKPCQYGSGVSLCLPSCRVACYPVPVSVDFWLPSRVRYVWAHQLCCLAHELLPGSCDGQPYDATAGRRPDPAAPRQWQRCAWLRADLDLSWRHLTSRYPARYHQAAIVLMVRGPRTRRGPDAGDLPAPERAIAALPQPWQAGDIGCLSWAEAGRRLHRRSRAIRADASSASIIVSRYLAGLPERTAEQLDQRAADIAERERTARRIAALLLPSPDDLPGGVDPYAGMPNPWLP